MQTLENTEAGRSAPRPQGSSIGRSRDCLIRAALGIWLTLPLACSSFPDSARPTARVLKSGEIRASDGIRYRQLSREDFRATSPPREAAAVASRLGAYTCVNIVPGAPRVQFTIVADPASRAHIATFPNAEYVARMDRECSWWNPKERLRHDYILEHEQIHFAIVEVSARRLEQDVRQRQGRGSTPQAAAAALKQSLDSGLHEAVERMLERSTSFDQDTSFGYDPSKQARWLRTVTEDLDRSR